VSWPTEPLLIGHRGAAAERPENTMVSFERAVALGVDVLETDVHMTADGRVVLSHDPSGARAAGVRQLIKRCSFEQVRAWDLGHGFVDAAGGRPFAGRGIRMPLLDELLGAFDEVRLNIDIKQREPPMVAPVLSLLRRHGAEHRVCLASFHAPVIRQVRAAALAGPTVLCRNEVLTLLALPRAWLARHPLGGDRVQVPPRFGPLRPGARRFIAKCHALGLAVDYWTINDPRHAEALLDAGADGIMTDDPAVLAPLFERRRRQ